MISIDPIKKIWKMSGYVDVFFTKFLKNIKNNQDIIFIVEFKINQLDMLQDLLPINNLMKINWKSSNLN